MEGGGPRSQEWGRRLGSECDQDALHEILKYIILEKNPNQKYSVVILIDLHLYITWPFSFDTFNTLRLFNVVSA